MVIYALKMMYSQTSIMYTAASQTSMNESPEVADKMQVLVQEVYDRTWNSAFLTSTQLILSLLAFRPLSE